MHEHPPTDTYPPIVGRLYPIPVYIQTAYILQFWLYNIQCIRPIWIFISSAYLAFESKWRLVIFCICVFVYLGSQSVTKGYSRNWTTFSPYQPHQMLSDRCFTSENTYSDSTLLENTFLENKLFKNTVSEIHMTSLWSNVSKVTRLHLVRSSLQSVTYRYRELPVSGIVHFFGGIRTGIAKIWYRLKVSEPVSEKFGTGN